MSSAFLFSQENTNLTESKKWEWLKQVTIFENSFFYQLNKTFLFKNEERSVFAVLALFDRIISY